jgi:hypothetical protein
LVDSCVDGVVRATNNRRFGTTTGRPAMHKLFGRIGFGIVALACAVAVAAPPQKAAPATRRPTKVTAEFLRTWPRQVTRHKAFDRLSKSTKSLISAGLHEDARRLPSIPTFQGSFTSGGVTFPYTMVGREPRRGGTTNVKTSYIELSFIFDEFVDENGNNIVINSSDITDDVLGSPNLVATDYTVGHGQFGDVVQRAMFFNVMRRDWHTTLERPRKLTPVQIEVPVGLADVQVSDAGVLFASVDDDFFVSQLNTILQLEDIRTDEVVMLVSHNVSTFFALGFHTAIDVTKNGRAGVQTFLWTSWFDLDLFGPIFADATTLTHEVSELIGDPFVNNMTPLYAIPNSGDPPFCLDFLETGDAIEFLDTQMFPVTVRGKLYHTQNEALLQWFSRESPSSAFQHAYSYPDTTVLTSPAPVCPN